MLQHSSYSTTVFFCSCNRVGTFVSCSLLLLLLLLQLLLLSVSSWTFTTINPFCLLTEPETNNLATFLSSDDSTLELRDPLRCDSLSSSHTSYRAHLVIHQMVVLPLLLRAPWARRVSRGAAVRQEPQRLPRTSCWLS